MNDKHVIVYKWYAGLFKGRTQTLLRTLLLEKWLHAVCDIFVYLTFALVRSVV